MNDLSQYKGNRKTSELERDPMKVESIMLKTLCATNTI